MIFVYETPLLVAINVMTLARGFVVTIARPKKLGTGHWLLGIADWCWRETRMARELPGRADQGGGPQSPVPHQFPVYASTPSITCPCTSVKRRWIPL